MASTTNIDKYVNQLYDSSATIIAEFLEDLELSSFADIPIKVWYNWISSIVCMASRIEEIRDNERLQEQIVYAVCERIIVNHVPADSREKVMKYFEEYGPHIIDVLIPGKDDDHIEKVCCVLKFIGKLF